MEGPAIYKHNDYYYAFGSYGNLAANYTIRMGRATNPTGPYYDKDGYECITFYPEINRYGCSILLGDDADQLSPGHPHIWEESGKFYLGYDYIPEKFPDEEIDILGIRRLYWVNDWPTIWTPVELTFNADEHPQAIGKILGISFRNVGETGSVLAVDSMTLSVSEATELKSFQDPANPKEFKIGRYFYNPFNHESTGSSQIPVHAPVELSIINPLGQKVSTTLEKKQHAGEYALPVKHFY
jgi:hypothetical protein